MNQKVKHIHEQNYLNRITKKKIQYLYVSQKQKKQTIQEINDR